MYINIYIYVCMYICLEFDMEQSVVYLVTNIIKMKNVSSNGSFFFICSFSFFLFFLRNTDKESRWRKKKRRTKNERKFDSSNSFHLLWNNNTQKNCTNESKQYSHYGWYVMFDSQKNRRTVSLRELEKEKRRKKWKKN